MFTENHKARIIGNIELKLLQIDWEENNIHSNLQEVNDFPARNSSGNSVFSEWEDDEYDTDQLRNYTKYEKIIKTNTLKFKTITF